MHHHNDAHGAGLAAAECGSPHTARPHHQSTFANAELIPTNGDAPTVASGRGARDQANTNTVIVADIDGSRKAFVTLRARFELAGFSLLELSDGSLLATRWNLCRPLPDATAALRFLRQIGGAS